MNAVAILAGTQHIVVHQRSGWPGGEIVHADHGSHESTHGLCQGCRVEPFVQGTAFIRLEMAEADPANLGGFDDLPNRLQQLWEHGPHSRVIQQRLVVLHKELVELQVEISEVGRDAIHVRCDFGDR